MQEISAGNKKVHEMMLKIVKQCYIFYDNKVKKHFFFHELIEMHSDKIYFKIIFKPHNFLSKHM